MKQLLCFGFLMLLLSACAAPPAKITTTKSGSPEVLINKPVAVVRSVIMEEMINEGVELEQESGSRLVFSSPPNFGQNLAMNLTMANGYSAKKVLMEYTLLPKGNKTRVVGKGFFWAQLPFGKVNKQQIKDNATYNHIQKYLHQYKAAAEGG